MPARKHKELRVGDKVGSRVVLRIAQPDPIGRRRVMAQCKCGKKRLVLECDVRRSLRCRSCAAKHREKVSE